MYISFIKPPWKFVCSKKSFDFPAKMIMLFTIIIYFLKNQICTETIYMKVAI